MSALRFMVAGSPNACHMSACSATIRSVTFSPPPPIRSDPPERRRVQFPARLDDRQGSVEVAEPAVYGTELGVLAVVLESAGADPEDEPAAGMWSIVRRCRRQVRVAYELQIEEEIPARVVTAIAACTVNDSKPRPNRPSG
jgi:hypothetical protein